MIQDLLALIAFCLIQLANLCAEPPNIVVILSDDQGWGDLSLNGNKNLSTPNIDSLARDGASFDRFFVCPVCSPTRAEFLTGRYHARSGVYSTSAGGERMDLDETTIGDTFKAAGYATGAFGKWHNGMQYPYHPNGRGFDEFYGFCSGHWGNYFNPPLDHNGRIVRGNGFVIDDFTDKAMEFMEKNRDRPFFAYLPYNTPHSPMQVPDRWWNKFKSKELEMHHRDPKRENTGHVRAALAMCENIDWNVGRILKKLDELNLADKTIVLYFCDNGPNGFRWNGGMKGKKGSTDEGGVRSPLLVRWPGRIDKGMKITQISAAIDLLPTLADLAGIKIASKKPLDGVSLKPLILGKPDEWKERVLINSWRGRVSARSQRFRLDNKGKLFDMVNDPGQYKDVSKAQADEAARLKMIVAEWRKDVLSELGKDERPLLIGHSDYKYTQIPARDGKTTGGIKRSNRFPNCSYFTNWKSVDDAITFPAEVGADGRYEVELHYACPKADVGSTIELSFNDSKLTARISQAHEAQQRGGEHDRVKRRESYVKDFKAMDLGTIHLKKGKGTLVLRATNIPGSQVVDFRLLMFTRAGD
ncbi:MAG: sulfatase-like hydrolase/transferase [Planctomycetota bacterium]|jgi:arylsulfatase A-like enzyme|nr:sulfatase-like hydrolase/transferase [Planctomycetota bacterium]MDP7248803.1 sulfatase-like hydrolase/transferase [Planctomycetota bacterium]